jgi:D-sedoheptulose 7-phosphate isomerase
MIKNSLNEFSQVQRETLSWLETSQVVQIAAEAVLACLRTPNGKLLLAGNGGSAADAQHMSGEYVSRFLFDRPALPAVALTTDSSILTAIGNDYGYQEVFARQVRALGRPGDVLMLYSTSGNSPNILEAARCGIERQLHVIALTGITGGALSSHCDQLIAVPSSSTPRIQEMHLLIGHLICEEVERLLYGGAPTK